MAKDFPDPDGAYAYMPPSSEGSPIPAYKIVPTAPASQSSPRPIKPMEE